MAQVLSFARPQSQKPPEQAVPPVPFASRREEIRIAFIGAAGAAKNWDIAAVAGHDQDGRCAAAARPAYNIWLSFPPKHPAADPVRSLIQNGLTTALNNASDIVQHNGNRERMLSMWKRAVEETFAKAVQVLQKSEPDFTLARR